SRPRSGSGRSRGARAAPSCPGTIERWEQWRQRQQTSRGKGGPGRDSAAARRAHWRRALPAAPCPPYPARTAPPSASRGCPASSPRPRPTGFPCRRAPRAAPDPAACIRGVLADLAGGQQPRELVLLQDADEGLAELGQGEVVGHVVVGEAFFVQPYANRVSNCLPPSARSSRCALLSPVRLTCYMYPSDLTVTDGACVQHDHPPAVTRRHTPTGRYPGAGSASG